MADNSIIPGNNQHHAYKMRGNTADIISAVIEADKHGVSYVEKFAPALQGEDVLTTCENIYEFIRQQIPYREDPDGKQYVQLPGALWNNRKPENGGTGAGGDCKSMALFASSVLRALGNYDFKYRFISERGDEDFHHVYLIVSLGDCYIPLDCTLDEFGVEVQYAKKKDMAPQKAPRMNGHPVANRSSRDPLDNIPARFRLPIGTAWGHPFINGIGDTQGEADWANWEAHEKDYANNLKTIEANVKQSLKNGIAFAHHGKPVVISKLKKMIDNNWGDLKKYSSTMLYHFWNASEVPYPTTGQIAISNKLVIKLDTSNKMVNDLKEIGARDGDLQMLCGLGTWFTYGCTADYMLYRCYNMLKYGQPFAPKPGVPYWDSHAGVFQANGASLGDAFAIGAVFPHGSVGIGRPFGEPYWALGGFIMGNGADENIVSLFALRNPKPTGPDAGTGVAEDFFVNVCVPKYNQWRTGEMVVLPVPLGGGYRPGSVAVHGIGEPITLSIGAIVALVTAIVGAIATIAGIIANALQKVKNLPHGENTPLPPKDFLKEFRTVDGCYIGVITGGANAGHQAKVCGDQVQLDPNLGAPENQPGSGTGAGSKKTLQYVGMAALAGGGLLMLNDSSQ